jgi:hypothetical protein
LQHEERAQLQATISALQAAAAAKDQQVADLWRRAEATTLIEVDPALCACQRCWGAQKRRAGSKRNYLARFFFDVEACLAPVTRTGRGGA